MNARFPALAERTGELTACQDVPCRPSAEMRSVSSFRRLFDAVWLECQPRLMKLAVGLGMRGDQAVDALQDVYVQVAQRPPAIEDTDELRRWLFRVTMNRCRLAHRQSGRWKRVWQALVSCWRGEQRAASQELFELFELKANVGQALAELSDDDRVLVVMRYLSDLNSREIGKIVGMPEATVRGRLRAARKKLAEELAEYDENT